MTPEQLYDFFKNHNLAFDDKRFLLAVSGGLDSMVLAHLFLRTHLHFSIAHCNFQLRDKESDADEAFTQSWCEQNGIDYFINSFDTVAIAREMGVSIQMCARELRYNWFLHLLKEHHIDYIVTAHHQDDDTETFFINLFRRSGLSGLKGIKPISNQVVRPLLDFTKEQLLIYAKEHNLEWRDDSSNHEAKYIRNKIRLELLPYLYSLIPDSRKAISDSQQLLKRDHKLIQELLTAVEEKYISIENETVFIDLNLVRDYNSNSTLLYHLISKYGFNLTQCENIVNSYSNSGSIFTSNKFKALIDRGRLIIQNKSPFNSAEHILIDNKEATYQLNSNSTLKVSYTLNENLDWKISIGLNANKISWPLKLRSWKDGDYFYPLGMKGKKQKLKKYFVNQKINRFDKEIIRLLVDADDQVVWIVGHRMDHRFVGNDLFIRQQ